MTDESRKVPKGRLSRFGKIAKLAGGVAGGMIAEGARQARAGNRPSTRDLLLTPGNARRLTRQLSEMRGAAMKLGQILSMDGGDFLPRELADILATLRSGAYAMPADQLDQVLSESFGHDWRNKLSDFESKPFAAASIGQVHRLKSGNGRDAVLKVQYPGVAESIDSDVDNLVSLLRISGLLPAQIEIRPILEEVKEQLREEADYQNESRYLNAFVRALGDDDRFLLPRLIPSLTTERVMGMTFVPGEAIEAVLDEEQEERDRVMSLLIELFLVELFDLRLVQTDPNFANYRYNVDTGQVALLDFGASRRFKAAFTRGYLDLLKARVEGDRPGMAAAAEQVGYSLGEPGTRYQTLVLDFFDIILEPVVEDAPYDFGNSPIARIAAELGGEMQYFKDFWEIPPIDAAYIHRKIAGLFLLASRLGARVNVNALLKPWLED
ncbi:hypothetical protein NOR51B_1478 [Luminiphilus syltensis NOR5-1B]|uniref:ABC1 atypical kinase-like domain-containing protein n=1 Tax=Luminiphilus syltensis NOR5-1B TaxID=565045 RepID=B8KWL5_9GAMM|nr:AarF/ABC1/UbiB kinase family protein [Luminiphilus syltensis]EED35532.1 hypothetical protein NOR51B_1478 [Luminiphilus syltensis NOR5-1B]